MSEGTRSPTAPARPVALVGADEGDRAAATEARATAPAVDVAALAQLWAGQFQHMTTLAVSGAGGLLVLLQTGLVKAGGRWWFVLALFALAALLGMMGQSAVVDDATRGAPPGRAARLIRGFVLMAFGAGAYGFARLFI